MFHISSNLRRKLLALQQELVAQLVGRRNAAIERLVVQRVA